MSSNRLEFRFRDYGKKPVPDAPANAGSFFASMGSKKYWIGGRLDFQLPLADAHSVRRGHAGNNDADLLVDLSNVSTAALPTWDDSEGTVYLEDGNGNARAVSWSQAGYAVSENGSIIARYPDPALTADPPHKPGKTYYISDSLGSDSQNGLYPKYSGGSNGPKKTMSAANRLPLSPGDAVLFRRGDTWTDIELRPDASGSSSNYIKYGAYGSGNDPLFDGNNVRQHLLYCGQSHIWFDSLDFYNGEGHDINPTRASPVLDGGSRLLRYQLPRTFIQQNRVW